MYDIKVNKTPSISSFSAQFNWPFGTLCRLSIYSCWWIHRFLSEIHCLFKFTGSHKSSLDDCVMSCLHSIQFCFESLCPLSPDPNTVHLAFRYSLWTVHLFMIHHCLPERFIFLPVFLSVDCYHINVQCLLLQLSSIGCSFSASVFPDSLPSSITCFLLLSHLSYTVYTVIYLLLQFSITQCFAIYLFYINKSNDFITQAFCYNSFHILPHCSINYFYIYLFVLSPILTMWIIIWKDF